MSLFLSPPQIAERLGVEPEKVRGWIRRGELVAHNVADRPTGRPRFRVSDEELQKFLDRRATVKPPKQARPKRQAGIKEFY